jgi:hypothetical protein
MKRGFEADIIGVVQAYDLDSFANSKLANISTRGFVSTGDNALFAGTIVVGPGTQKVIIRALGPSTGGSRRQRGEDAGFFAASDEMGPERFESRRVGFHKRETNPLGSTDFGTKSWSTWGFERRSTGGAAQPQGFNPATGGSFSRAKAQRG